MPFELSHLGTSDGHLRDVSLEFLPGLNCIIGARGTCKSTIVETIRFLFDDDRRRVEELLRKPTRGREASEGGLIAATLGGGTAQLRLREVGDDEDLAVIERDTAAERPTIYRDGVIVVEDPHLLSEIEIYSQGELQEIATSAGKRLELIDRPNQAEIDGWRGQIEDISVQVAEIGPQLREVAEAIEAGEASLADGAPLVEQLEQLRADRPELSGKVTELRSAHQQRDRQLEVAETLVEGYRDEVEALGRIQMGLAEVSEEASELRATDSTELRQIVEHLDVAASAVGGLLKELAETDVLDRLLVAARKKSDVDSKPYYEALREEEAMTDRLKQEDRLGEEVKKLERVRATLKANQKRQKKLRSDRAKLRASLRDLRTRIFDLRSSEVEGINEKYSERIVLSLRQGTQSESYRQSLESLLDGSRLRDRPNLCSELAATFPPDALIDAIEADDSTRLAKTLGRDVGQMVRLVSHLSGNEAIFGLESEVPDDELDVTMFIKGKAHDVSALSKGQKATAMLPLLLRSAEYPLILDQPEDDLDNRFIVQTLVETIKELKTERQLIFVTHNANIPVIGDADRVIAMGMSTPDRAELTRVGNVTEMREPIIELLEGGRQAFALRSESYGLPDP